jgi:hypothetical protein
MSRICDICSGFVNRNDKDKLPATWFCSVGLAKGSEQFLCVAHRHDGRCCAEMGPAAIIARSQKQAAEAVDHPKHYNDHPSAVECIDIVEHLPFNIGNAIKYLWRAGIKATPTLEDLEKARWYVEREIRRLKRPTVAITPEVRQRVRDMIYTLGAPTSHIGACLHFERSFGGKECLRCGATLLPAKTSSEPNT